MNRTKCSNSIMESKRNFHPMRTLKRLLKKHWKRPSSDDGSESTHSTNHPSSSRNHKTSKRVKHPECIIHKNCESNSSNLSSKNYSFDSTVFNFSSTDDFVETALIIKDSSPINTRILDQSDLKPTTDLIHTSSDTQNAQLSECSSDLHSTKGKRAKNNSIALQVPSVTTDIFNGSGKNPTIMQVSVSAKVSVSEQEIRTSSPQETINTTRNNFTCNIDQRYGGQYLTPEQLPDFCDQLRHLVEMIRNIQSYASVTGEYPSTLEKRLQQEAREVAALAAEVRNARDSIERARCQRRAVRAQMKDIIKHLVALREEEIRELENTVRTADRKLLKSWDNLKDAVNVQAFDSLLAEVKEKQNALECMSRLISNRCATLQLLAATALTPRPSVPSSAVLNKHPRGRYHPYRRPLKRKWKERENPSYSVPVSNEASLHSNADSNRLQNQIPNVIIANHRSINSVISNQSPRNSINMNPMTVPYELISQSGIPPNMLPSMGSNSNYNLSLNVAGQHSLVPFSAVGPQPETTADVDRSFLVVVNSAEDQ